jgi:hypothetical protein
MGRFFLPAKVWHPAHGGTAIWDIEFQTAALADRVGNSLVDPKTGEAIIGELEESAQVGYRPWRETETERKAKRDGEGWRIISPIRRLDEDGNLYDLVRVFFEEYRLYPFATHDDLIDAMSRLYDMETTPAVRVESESEAMRPNDWDDA